MNNKVNLIRPDGTSIQVDVICSIENTKSGKKYLYYTLNEIVGTGASSTVKIYVSKIMQGNPQLDEPISEMEWEGLKNVMGDILRGNTTPDVKYIPLTDLNVTSVSDKVIAMPTSYDYINKHRGVYAQTIAVLEQTTTENSAEIPASTNPEPAVEETNNSAISQVEPQIVNETPVTVSNVESPIEQSVMQSPVVEVKNPINTASSAAIPIEISDIEKKYDELINDLLSLKEKEIEAVKRYNATLELSSMHNAQHANYIENENNKQLNNVESVPAVEPAPISTIVPEPENVMQTSPTNIETNWFDMPTE